MTKTTQPTDAEMRVWALSRWEGEGGALAPTGMQAASRDDSRSEIGYLADAKRHGAVRDFRATVNRHLPGGLNK